MHVLARCSIMHMTITIKILKPFYQPRRRNSITKTNFKWFTINVTIIVLELLERGQFKKNCSKLKTELWLMKIALPPESIHQEHQKWNCYWFSDHFGYHCNLWFQHKKKIVSTIITWSPKVNAISLGDICLKVQDIRNHMCFL